MQLLLRSNFYSGLDTAFITSDPVLPFRAMFFTCGGSLHDLRQKLKFIKKASVLIPDLLRKKIAEYYFRPPRLALLLR